MALADDLNSAAALCANAADAATTKLIGLGPRPTEPVAAALWDHKDAILKTDISVLNNLSSTISAVIISNALKQLWPQLQGLNDITTSAEADIAATADISKAFVKIASIIDFGVSVAALAAQPSPSAVQAVISAVTKMRAS